MNISKLASLTLIPLSIVLLSGCASLKKKSSTTPAPDANAPAAATPAPAVVAPAPVAVAPAPAPAKAPKPPVLDVVMIRSVPSGAPVYINGNQVGMTPLLATLDRANKYTVTLMQPGYVISSQTVQAQTSVSGSPAGKIGVSYSPAHFPSVVTVKLSPIKDPLKSLEAAVAMLDSQLRKGQISTDDYNQRVKEVTRFYSQAQ